MPLCLGAFVGVGWGFARGKREGDSYVGAQQKSLFLYAVPVAVGASASRVPPAAAARSQQMQAIHFQQQLPRVPVLL